MRLRDLKPQFVKFIDEWTFKKVDDIVDADGICFLCPKCFEANQSAVGTHSIICWQPHVPQTMEPKPGRWKFEGTGYEDLTLTASSSSILLLGGCKAHFFVKGGEIK